MAGNPRSTQEYYDSIDRKDPRKAVVIPRVDDEEISRFGTMILAFLSIILVLLTLPFSLCYCVKVVQEYERAVIFRLGRLLSGGARGPGVFFVIPCVDVYEKVDLRTNTYEIPPQEVGIGISTAIMISSLIGTDALSDPDQGQRDGVCECHHVLQGGQRHPRRV